MVKKTIKGILVFLGTVFLLLNVIINFHAYKFTHFAANEPKLQADKKWTVANKMDVVVFGVSNSRPVNTHYPSQPYQTVKIKSNVMLEAWDIKTDSVAKGTVIIFHGYRADKSQMIDRSDEFLKLGYNTLLVDFMGSGGSEGNNTTIGFKEAEEVKATYDYVAGTGEKNIYLFGTSMGAVAIMKAISDYHIEPAGAFLECPFGTMYKTVCARFRLMGLPTFPYADMLMFWGGIQNGFWAFNHNPVEYAKTITCPTLLLYGEADNRVSREEIDEIYNNLAGKKQLVTYPLSGHEDYFWRYHDKWVEDVTVFLNKN